MSGPLEGIRVIDLSRLAPGPYCTMLLADLGAEVIVVGGGRAGAPVPQLARGKKHITLDLKGAGGRHALQTLVASADVVVEGFRPGVADRIGAGFDELVEVKPDLIYCSLTGYGQNGPRALEAGHDINYLAATGFLGSIGPLDGPPIAPLNLLADFGGGGLVAAFGILAALRGRDYHGEPQHVDAAMIDGVMSMMTMHYPSWGSSVLPDRGRGLLAGEAPFYRCYECADGQFVAVGAIEDAFFAALWNGLGFTNEEVPQHMDVDLWPELSARIGKAFAQHERQHWAEIFDGTDACVTPVLSPDEAWSDPQISTRLEAAQTTPVIPKISPQAGFPGETDLSDRTAEVLSAAGLDQNEIREATPDGPVAMTGLSWPPKL